MNKKRLLEIMDEHDACWAARDYVARHKSNHAAVIGSTCDNGEWLIWLLAQLGRLDRFVTVAARRSRRPAYDYRHRHAGESAARYLTGRSWCDADDASYCARFNAADYTAEREAQLKALHRIWRDWCAGKPAEKAVAL